MSPATSWGTLGFMGSLRKLLLLYIHGAPVLCKALGEALCGWGMGQGFAPPGAYSVLWRPVECDDLNVPWGRSCDSCPCLWVTRVSSPVPKGLCPRGGVKEMCVTSLDASLWFPEVPDGCPELPLKLRRRCVNYLLGRTR